MKRFVFFTGLLLGACSPPGAHSRSPAEGPADSFAPTQQESCEELSSFLLPPTALPLISWRQRLSINFSDRAFKLGVVVQNVGTELQLLGLGPANAKLFLITQGGDNISLKTYVDRPLPLCPERLLLDMQMALFWFPEHTRQKVWRPKWSSRFCVQDEWGDSGLLRRVVAEVTRECSEQSFPATAPNLRIEYTPHYAPYGPPSQVTLSGDDRGYSILVQHLQTLESP